MRHAIEMLIILALAIPAAYAMVASIVAAPGVLLVAIPAETALFGYYVLRARTRARRTQED